MLPALVQMSRSRSSRNTVQLGGRMVVWGGWVGRGHCWWRERLTCHLRYLRLITRGLERRRRTGLSRWQISTIVWRQPWSPV